MYETDAELAELQDLLDTSLARSTEHLRSIITGSTAVTAAQLVRILTGMCVLSAATVTARGEPRVSGVDGHFLHGNWVFTNVWDRGEGGSSASAACDERRTYAGGGSRRVHSRPGRVPDPEA